MPKYKREKDLKIQDLNFDQLRERIQTVIDKLNNLVVRVTEKTELAVFLTEICSNFRFEVKDNWSNLDVITVDDELEALRLMSNTIIFENN